MLACLLGLWRTGRWRMAYAFTLYVTLVLVLGPLQTWVPSTFNNWTYWSFKQAIYDVAKLALAIELACRICRHFPGARASVERWLLVVLLSMAAGLIWHPWSSDPVLTWAGEIRARAAIGTLWLFAVTLAAARHYRLPVHPFLMGLLVGLGGYLAVFGALLRLLQIRGWAAYDLWATVDPPAYAALAIWLAWISWRKDSAATEDYEAVVSLFRTRTV